MSEEQLIAELRAALSWQLAKPAENPAGFTLGYLTRSELCDPTQSPFADYNAEVFAAVDVMVKS